ncbi:MAG: hypothetical protein ABW252_20800 [Polyangiales bacterium]
MVLHRSRWALAGTLALWVAGCAADAADEAQSEIADELAPAQALVVTQADVTSADQGSTPARPTEPTRPAVDEDDQNDERGSTGSTGSSGRADPRATGGSWDAASVARFCFLLDERMQFLCRVTLTDCTKPARPLDIFTQVLCQLRGFLPGAPSSTSSPSSSGSSDTSSASSGRANPSPSPSTGSSGI